MKRISNRADRPSLLRRVLAIGGAAGVLGAAIPADARIESARQTLEARVLAVRVAMHESVGAGPRGEPDQTVAQWFNWPNWGNWNNWPNWGNWFNR
jgi:hypothetical protein